MDKQGVREFLENSKLEYEWYDHCAVYSMDDLIDVELPHAECDAKNLFVTTPHREIFFLITVKGNKRTDLKAFRAMQGTKRLEFCKEDDLREKLDIYPGAVSPFCILNNTECDVKFFMDEDFFADEGIIGCHPNDNTGTVFLKAQDMVDIVKNHGNDVEIIKIPERE